MAKKVKTFLCRHCRRRFVPQKPPGRPRKKPRYECPHCGEVTGPPKTIAELKRERWKLISEIVRRTEADSRGIGTCITCGCKKKWQEMSAGHYLPSRSSGILFDRRGIHMQCGNCNGPHGGQQLKYHEWMMRNYGELVCDRLRWAKDNPPGYSREELEAAIISETIELRRIIMGTDPTT